VCGDRQLPERMAEIESLARRVDEKPRPSPWTAARQGDLLKRKDGLRTRHGSFAGHRFGEGHAVAGSRGLLRLEAHEGLSGVESIVYRWGGEAWRHMKGDTLRVPAGVGPHVLELWAKDRRGRRSMTWKVPVEIEGGAPAPPRVGRRNVPAGGRTR